MDDASCCLSTPSPLVRCPESIILCPVDTACSLANALIDLTFPIIGLIAQRFMTRNELRYAKAEVSSLMNLIAINVAVTDSIDVKSSYQLVCSSAPRPISGGKFKFVNMKVLRQVQFPIVKAPRPRARYAVQVL